jgi:hypothetical protein
LIKGFVAPQRIPTAIKLNTASENENIIILLIMTLTLSDLLLENMQHNTGEGERLSLVIKPKDSTMLTSNLINVYDHDLVYPPISMIPFKYCPSACSVFQVATFKGSNHKNCVRISCSLYQATYFSHPA